MKTAPEALSASGAVLGLSGYMSSELVLVIALVLSLVVLLVLAVRVVFVVGLVLAAAAVGGRIVVVIVVVLHIKLTSLSTPLVSPVLFRFMQKIRKWRKVFQKGIPHLAAM